MLWPVSEACQMSTSARMVFKMAPAPLDKQIAEFNSPHNWLVS